MKSILCTLLLIVSLSGINAQTNSQAEDWYGPVTISFHGFICNRTTNDDALGMDGVGDEVSVHFWNWTTVATNRANFNGMSRIYGEDFLLPSRVKAGSATINGGIKSGDSYNREGVYGDGDPQILSNYAIINTFCSQNTLIAILPTIWERDNGTLGVTPIQDFGVATNSAFNDMAIKQKIWEFRDSYTYNDNNPYGYFVAGRNIGLDAKYAGMFTAHKNKLASRPIGLFPNWDFSSQLLVLTPKTIKIIAEKDYGYGKGIIPVLYNEESLGNTFGHGNYIILLRVVADIKLRNPPTAPVNKYAVGIQVNALAAGERFEFSIDGTNRVTVTEANKPFYFPQKLSTGQQFRITQLSGPGTCQLGSSTGTVGSKDTVVSANCGTTSTGYKVGVAYASSMMSVYDRFEFQLASGEKIVLDSGHKTAYFSQRFQPGQSYKITQVSGTRTCSPLSASDAEGVITNSDVIGYVNCGMPPFSIVKLDVKGIEAGETFKFTDSYGRTLSLPFSTIANMGGFPVGDPLIIKQTAGPRQCIITPSSGVIPNSPLTIQCDCRKNPGTDTITSSSNGTLKGTFSAPAGTKIVLQLNNKDTLVLTQSANSGTSWLQTMNFRFPKSYLTGTEYSVRIKTAPLNLGCVVYENAEGRIAENGPVVRVRCDKTYDLVSRSTDNKILNTYYESFNPVIGGTGEDEGRYIAFGAYGKGMDGSSGNYRQVFWRDRKTGETKLISKSATGAEGNQNSQLPAISADGKSVAFESYATNLADGDNNGARDVFVWNENTGTVSLVSQAQQGGTANGESYEPAISGDGRVIAYTSHASNIVLLSPVFSTPNVYVNIKGGTTELITKDFETGKAASGYSPSISDDGTRIAFCAYTSRLVKDDKNNLWDIFLWQSDAAGLKRISLTSTWGERDQGTESASRVVAPSLSGDGRFVAYATTATNMVAGDNNGLQDIYLYTISSGSVKRISTGSNNADSDGDSPIAQGEKVGISYDGSWITYNTTATNLGVPKGNIVLQNTGTGKITPITELTGGSTARPLISTYGGYIIAGCSEKYDKRFPSSGIFTFHTINLMSNQ